jgi:hypothetical protein
LFSDPTASNNIVQHRADQELSTMLSHRQPSIKLPSPAKASTMAWCIRNGENSRSGKEISSNMMTGEGLDY